MKNLIAVITLSLAIMFSTSYVALSGDSHAEYYYPPVTSQESYAARVSGMAGSSKRSRVGFTVGLNAQQLARNYAPSYHIFAKGFAAQKLIIVAVDSNRYQTLFRLRALAAALTASARTSPLFSKLPNPENLTFYDLCKMAGFTQITLTNGDDIAHRIWIN